MSNVEHGSETTKICERWVHRSVFRRKLETTQQTKAKSSLRPIASNFQYYFIPNSFSRNVWKKTQWRQKVVTKVTTLCLKNRNYTCRQAFNQSKKRTHSCKISNHNAKLRNTLHTSLSSSLKIQTACRKMFRVPWIQASK